MWVVGGISEEGGRGGYFEGTYIHATGGEAES